MENKTISNYTDSWDEVLGFNCDNEENVKNDTVTNDNNIKCKLMENISTEQIEKMIAEFDLEDKIIPNDANDNYILKDKLDISSEDYKQFNFKVLFDYIIF